MSVAEFLKRERFQGTLAGRKGSRQVTDSRPQKQTTAISPRTTVIGRSPAIKQRGNVAIQEKRSIDYGLRTTDKR